MYLPSASPCGTHLYMISPHRERWERESRGRNREGDRTRIWLVYCAGLYYEEYSLRLYSCKCQLFILACVWGDPMESQEEPLMKRWGSVSHGSGSPIVSWPFIALHSFQDSLVWWYKMESACTCNFIVPRCVWVLELLGANAVHSYFT